ncbi:stalk domain-containing protein [Paenibacillus oryzisoli]|uniref:stalk domain-containing protein n=1 Tax=Paenibacillus oryzisoli TaxID=1850517 RepID=UPI0012F94E80|nr:stalk domain-containing protein [Paenibacillus oryzisoli]
MNKWLLALTCCMALFTATAVFASDTIQIGRQVKVNGKVLDTQVEISRDGTTLTSTRAIAEALGAKVSWNESRNTVEIHRAEDTMTFDENQSSYANYVSLLLQGRYSLKIEIIGKNLGARSDTMVVFADGYVDVPENTDYQKLFLLLLADQIGDLPLAKEQVEFWSNKELAQTYVAGKYMNDRLEGWSGLDARFGLLTKEGGKLSLSHILSIHERDSVSIGKYKPQ